MVSLKFEREDLAAQMEDLEHHNQDFIQQTQELNTKKRVMKCNWNKLKDN